MECEIVACVGSGSLQCPDIPVDLTEATGGHRRAPARLTEEDTDTQERTLAVSVSPSSLEGEREVNGMDDGNPSMFW